MNRRIASCAVVLLMLGCLAVICYGSRRPGADVPEGQYLITEYGDDTGQQLMFYTIQDRDGHLMIVDGGYDYNADFVREVIKKAGGIVDYWILTHPHPDHIGAFNTIFADPGEIKIGTVYTIEMNHDAYQANAKEWDGFFAYESFLNVTSESQRVEFLHTGEERELMGLRLVVISAYEDSLINDTKDLANNGSMVFKLYGKSQSMLFCADITQVVCGRILAQFGEVLKSDYVQMGHHGNWGPDVSFYEWVSPKVAFFDSPSWLIEDRDTYDAGEMVKNMQDMGAEVYTFQTAPNSVILR